MQLSLWNDLLSKLEKLVNAKTFPWNQTAKNWDFFNFWGFFVFDSNKAIEKSFMFFPIFTTKFPLVLSPWTQKRSRIPLGHLQGASQKSNFRRNIKGKLFGAIMTTTNCVGSPRTFLALHNYYIGNRKKKSRSTYSVSKQVLNGYEVIFKSSEK